MARYYRIVQPRWRKQALSGEGARRYGGRWNPPGIAAVYLAESRALASLEMLVHAPREALQIEWCLLEVDVPIKETKVLSTKSCPRGWQDYPSSIAAREWGGQWLVNAEQLALQVPSVIIPEEHNILLNPNHPKMKKVKIVSSRPFFFDQRFHG